MNLSTMEDARILPRRQLHGILQMLWRDSSILLLGALLHLFLLCPRQELTLFFGKEGFFPVPLKWLFPGYLCVLVLFYVIPWGIRCWRDAMYLRSSELDPRSWRRRQSRFLMTGAGALAILPLPLYFLVISACPSVGILGIVICLLFAKLLMVSGSQYAMPGKYAECRHLHHLSLTRGVLSSIDLKMLLLTFLGSILMGYYVVSGGMLSGNMGQIRNAYCMVMALFSLACEIRQGHYEHILSIWRRAHGMESERRPQILRLCNRRTLHVWTVLVLLAIVFPDYMPLHWFLLLMIRQLWCICWLYFSHFGRQSIPIAQLIDSSGRLLVFSFLFLILLGSAVLALPCVTQNGQSIGILNAMFTATSAVCVTGLSIFDVALVFNSSGMTVLCVLIQCGGLGIMTISFFVAQLLSKSVGIHGNVAVQEMTGERRAAEARTLLRIVVLGTFLVEAVGAVILAPYYHSHLHISWMRSVGMAVFMSISAFCSAGFSIHPGSMTGFFSEPLPVWTLSFLIMIGGMSFLVLVTLWKKLRRPNLQHTWGVHTRLVLMTTIPIWLVGTLLFYLLERHYSLEGLGVMDALRNAWFHTVSSRTAGFNTVDTAAMAQSSKLLMIWMMFVGVAPGSTGGGIKVTALGIFFLVCRSWLLGEQEIRFAGRRISSQVILQAGMCAMLMLVLVLTGAFLLSITMPERPLTDLTFEAVSAAATVGMTLDVTPYLTTAGKWVVMFLMFAGRIGPLTMLVAFVPRRRSTVSAPEANVLIG